MLRLALGSRAWTEDGISIRTIRGDSGHNGERWSAIAGGVGHLLELGDTASGMLAGFRSQCAMPLRIRR
jgi:hypothetical protein